MTEEEKRFKILKKESYEKSIKGERNCVIADSLNTAIMAALAVLQLTGMFGDDLTNIIVGTAASAGSMIWLANTINAICKKTLYEIKLEDTNRELEMLEQNESRGMKR